MWNNTHYSETRLETPSTRYPETREAGMQKHPMLTWNRLEIALITLKLICKRAHYLERHETVNSLPLNSLETALFTRNELKHHLLPRNASRNSVEAALCSPRVHNTQAQFMVYTRLCLQFVLFHVRCKWNDKYNHESVSRGKLFRRWAS